MGTRYCISNKLMAFGSVPTDDEISQPSVSPPYPWPWGKSTMCDIEHRREELNPKPIIGVRQLLHVRPQLRDSIYKIITEGSLTHREATALRVALVRSLRWATDIFDADRNSLGGDALQVRTSGLTKEEAAAINLL